MNAILLSFSQDPAAIMECLAAILTACYLLRLSLLPLGLELEAKESPKIVVPAPASSLATGIKKATLRDKLLRFFAVGETIIVAKRSLRGQALRRVYFW